MCRCCLSALIIANTLPFFIHQPLLWKVVGYQVFRSLAIAQSSLLSLSSFNNFHEPILTWSVLVGSVVISLNIATALTTYSLLGIVGYKHDIPTTFFTKDDYFFWVSVFFQW